MTLWPFVALLCFHFVQWIIFERKYSWLSSLEIFEDLQKCFALHCVNITEGLNSVTTRVQCLKVVYLPLGLPPTLRKQCGAITHRCGKKISLPLLLKKAQIVISVLGGYIVKMVGIKSWKGLSCFQSNTAWPWRAWARDTRSGNTFSFKMQIWRITWLIIVKRVVRKRGTLSLAFFVFKRFSRKASHIFPFI